MTKVGVYWQREDIQWKEMGEGRFEDAFSHIKKKTTVGGGGGDNTNGGGLEKLSLFRVQSSVSGGSGMRKMYS